MSGMEGKKVDSLSKIWGTRITIQLTLKAGRM